MTMRWLPGRAAAWVLALGLFVVLLPKGSLALALVFDTVVVLLMWQESRNTRRLVPELKRLVDSRFVLGADNRVTIVVRNRSGRRLRLRVRDDYPEGFAPSLDELVLEVPPHGRCEAHYDLSPHRRGRHQFGDLHLRIEGVTGLGALLVTMPMAQEIRVYPNVRTPRRYALAARLGALHSLGVRTTRLAGGAGEFEMLREYVPGDPFRDLDWKATAKRLRPVTRVNGQERSQTVVIAVDAGRMMAAQLGKISKLDHALNAALLLAYVALRGGDRVGLVVFASEVQQFVPPGRGNMQYRRILEALYGVHAGEQNVDFGRFTQFVRARLPKRSLLVVFSDLMDEAQVAPLVRQALLLRRKHLPLCVTMSDPVAESLCEMPVADAAQVYTRAAAADVLADREAVKFQLRRNGINLVEARAAELAVSSVNRYLEIRNRL